METPSFTGLLVVAAIALAAPLLVGLVPAIRVPAVVLEIVAGIAVGPSGFGWVKVDVAIQVLALVGLAFLLFLAGLEIDVERLRGPRRCPLGAGPRPAVPTRAAGRAGPSRRRLRAGARRRQAVAAGLLQATSLPFLVTATAIGVTLGEIKPVNGAALVSAGLLSVVVFPLVALSLLRSAPDTVDSTR